MLRVSHRVTNHILEKHLEHTAGFLVNQTGDTLDTSTTCETTNGGFGDTLDVIAENFAMTLGSSLS